MEVNGTTYNSNTSHKVIDVLESACATQRRVRLFYGDRQTGKSWFEEHDITGTIGRSCGRIKVPLLIARRDSKAGPPILDDCIIAIQTSPGAWAYRQDNFNVPLEISTEGGTESLPVCVYDSKDLILLARFSNWTKAKTWVAFQRGERWKKI